MAAVVKMSGILAAFLLLSSSSGGAARYRMDAAQVPDWTRDDLDFFLHGSMGTEVFPERALRAFEAAYPDLFPGGNLSAFGVIEDPRAGMPVGFSRRRVPHLGNQVSLGINCASCHVGEVDLGSSVGRRRVLGMTSNLDVEAFLGSFLVSMLRTADPEGMERFLPHYLAACDPGAGPRTKAKLAGMIRRQSGEIRAAVAADPFGAADIAPGSLHEIATEDLRLDRRRLAHNEDLVPVVRALLRLFHNVRAAIHVPDEIPAEIPPASGPGRNAAWGLLSQSLLGIPKNYAPIKYGIVWNIPHRDWVHWDGNTRDPLVRNLLAALGLGAPIVETGAILDFSLVRRQTDVSERIRAPRYPLPIDAARARHGGAIYRAQCASCHEASGDARLVSLEEIGTDPERARLFDAQQVEKYGEFFRSIRIEGWRPSDTPALRATGRYWSAPLAGVWARAPYLHNGSVRTLRDLLSPPAERPATYRRGSRRYDPQEMGYADEGPYLFDTARPGNSKAGHDYGTRLADAERGDLLEYLKTL